MLKTLFNKIKQFFCCHNFDLYENDKLKCMKCGKIYNLDD
jgi:hypothetical protein